MMKALKVDKLSGLFSRQALGAFFAPSTSEFRINIPFCQTLRWF